MIIDQYTEDNYGPMYGEFIRGASNNMKEKDDDFVMIIIGATGSGKSNLGLWTQSIVIENPRIEQVALTREDLARSLKAAKDSPLGDRYMQYDEGKLNRRDWMGNWSKELLEVYHDIRGLRIFHVWCSAMPNLLEREFIKERVNAICYCYDKAVGRPRHFLLFTKADILKFLQQNETLSMDTLKKYGKSHATMQSWFRQYKGPMNAEYAQKKENRMMQVVDGFFQRWGAGDMTTNQVADVLGVNPQTVNNWRRAHLEEGADFKTRGSGVARITPEGLAKLRQISEYKQRNGNSLRGIAFSTSLAPLTYPTARFGEKTGQEKGKGGHMGLFGKKEGDMEPE